MFTLVYNAFKYTNRGFILIKVKAAGLPIYNMLQIKIIDSGCGMEDSQIQRLFSLFQNVKHKK